MTMASIFTELKYPSIMGDRTIRDQKRSKRVLKKEFSELVADEIEKQVSQQTMEAYGVPYREGEARPADGATAVVPDQKMAVMLDVLAQNGLARFEHDKAAIDVSIKDVAVKSGEGDYIELIPIECELLLKKPLYDNGYAEVDFHVVLMDPRIVDENGNPLNDGLPRRYIRAVLNNYSPIMLYRGYYNELDDMLSRAGDQAEAYKKVIQYAAQQWKNRQTPDDFKTLQAVVSMGMLHEFTHALALHLPDLIPESASAETKRDLGAITFDHYCELIMNDNVLITSGAFNKNLFKALCEAREKEPSKKTQSTINASLVLEMFCDRFGMFLYQNYLKIQIYSALFKKADLPFSVNIDSMLLMETRRHAGQLREIGGLSGILDEKEFQQLETELGEAENSHYYISKFGDPALTHAEIKFYGNFLALLNHFDNEKLIMRFTMEHAENSRFMRVSVKGLADTKAHGD